MKGNPKRRLQRLIISSKNRHRGHTPYIYSHGGDGEQFPIAAVALYSPSQNKSPILRPTPFSTDDHHPSHLTPFYSFFLF